RLPPRRRSLRQANSSVRRRDSVKPLRLQTTPGRTLVPAQQWHHRIHPGIPVPHLPHTTPTLLHGISVSRPGPLRPLPEPPPLRRTSAAGRNRLRLAHRHPPQHHLRSPSRPHDRRRALALLAVLGIEPAPRLRSPHPGRPLLRKTRGFFEIECLAGSRTRNHLPVVSAGPVAHRIRQRNVSRRAGLAPPRTSHRPPVHPRSMGRLPAL